MASKLEEVAQAIWTAIRSPGDPELLDDARPDVRGRVMTAASRAVTAAFDAILSEPAAPAQPASREDRG